MELPYYLNANWPAPHPIRALTVTYPMHMNNPVTDLNLPAEPVWLHQTHQNICVRVEKDTTREADAAITSSRSHPLVIKTADCLPILLCDKSGTEIAAIHAGWRSLSTGIVENTLKQFQAKRDQLIAWTGPAICQSCFEVGQDVFDAFTTRYPFSLNAFVPAKNTDKYFADLAFIAELILNRHQVSEVYHARACTFEEKNKFYSYRRARQTGRMMTLIWFAE